MINNKKSFLILTIFFLNISLNAQNIDSIFNSIDDNFNKSLESQNQMLNFYIDDFEL